MTKMQFLPACGENVVISDSQDRQTATWRFLYTGGIAFSSAPLRIGEIVELTLSETGHAQIGLMYRSPADAESVRKAYESDIQVISDVRVHKKQSKLTVQLMESSTNEYQAVFKHSHSVQVTKTGLRKGVWLVVHLQFGSIKAVLDTTSVGPSCATTQQLLYSGSNMVFHDIKGENIKRSSNGKEISLREGNPASVCCLSLPLHPGKVVELGVCPVITDGKEAKKFSVRIGCAKKDPADFKEFASRFLRVGERTPGDKPWQSLVKIEKACDVTIQNLGRNELQINDDLYTIESLADDRQDVCIILELFRVKVTILRFEDTECLASGASGYEDVTHRIESQMEEVEHALESKDSQKVDLKTLKLNDLKKNIEDAYCTIFRQSKSLDGYAGRTGKEPSLQSEVREHTVEQLYESIKRIGTSLQQHIEQGEDQLNSRDTQSESAVEICTQIRTILEQILNQNLSQNANALQCQSNPTQKEIQQVLRTNFQILVSDLELSSLMDHLYQNNVISRDDFEHLREIYKRDKREARRDFLMMFSGSKPFNEDVFCKAFKDTRQEWLLDLENR